MAAAGLGAAAVMVEWLRALAARTPELALLELVLGGGVLCLFGFFFSPAELGLSRRRLVLKLVGGLALAGLFVLPTALRSATVPQLPLQFAAAAVLVAAGEEIAFRGAVFAALRAVAGPPAAIAGSTLLFTLAHLLSHPTQFLLPVAALGLLLGLWRWAFDDLVAPVVGHVLADLAL